MQQRTEGNTRFWTRSETEITRKMPVFYNPKMQLNRDLTLLALYAMDNIPRIALPMAASGVRAARIINELLPVKPDAFKSLDVNDVSEEAFALMQKNVQESDTVTLHKKDAVQFLRASKGFEYIDIDPFGFPGPYLDSAVQRISRGGILAVTATDTGALTGTFPSATRKKYWSTPRKCWMMHELGLRILIRKIQLVAAQYDKPLTPMLSVAKDHYYKVFLRCEMSMSELRDILSKHQNIAFDGMQYEVTRSTDGDFAGPLWTGQLHDREFVKKMLEGTEKLPTKARDLLETISKEATSSVVGFYTTDAIARYLKMKSPKTDVTIRELHAVPAHYHAKAFKTAMPFSEVERIFASLSHTSA